MIAVFCESAKSIGFTEIIGIIIAFAAFAVSILAYRENKKGVQFQRLLLFIEKESDYASEFVEQKVAKNSQLADDKLKQYMNLFEALALCYISNEIPRKNTRSYFETVLRKTYEDHKEEINSKILDGDFAELNKLLHQWGLK